MGLTDPLSLAQYEAHSGYAGLRRALALPAAAAPVTLHIPGSFTATNDVYVYHGASCSPLHAGANGPGDYTSHIPADAVHLLSAPLSGVAGVQAVQTIDPLLPGFSNGLPLYRSFSSILLNPGDCLVTLYGIQGSSAGFDNENQLHLIVQSD